MPGIANTRPWLIGHMREMKVSEGDIRRARDASTDEDRIKVFEDMGFENAGEVNKVWKKTVTIKADAGEEVRVINDDEDEMETESAEETDEEIVEKARQIIEADKAAKAAEGDAKRRDIVKTMIAMRGGMGGPGGAPAIRTSGSFSVQEKAYDAKVTTASRLPVPMRPQFASGEEAMLWGSFLRKSTMDTISPGGYEGKTADLGIIGKDMSTTDANLGGALVPTLLQERIIDNKNQYGAARRAAQVVTMQSLQEQVIKLGADPVAREIGENDEGVSDEFESSLVELTTKQVGVDIAVPRTLMTASPIDIADTLGGALTRAFAKYEDESYLYGSNSYAGRGLDDLVGTTYSIYDNAGSSWTDWGITDFTNTMGLLGGRAYGAGIPPFISSVNFFKTTTGGFAAGAGGLTPSEIFSRFSINPDGISGVFDGHPWLFTDAAPNSFSANQKVAFHGGFALASIIGEYLGGMTIDVSEHARIRKRQLLYCATSYIAINTHSVADEESPLVVVMQD